MENIESNNPLLMDSGLPFKAVAFGKINADDYEPAILDGIRLHNEEIDRIASNPEPPSFENTVAVLDRSGRKLSEAVATLSNLENALGQPRLMEIMTEVTPQLSNHNTEILLNDKLWNRIKFVYDSRSLRSDLSGEALRLIEETYRDFAESGANLEGEARETFRSLSSKLSELSVRFSQNVTNEMASKERRMWISEEETEGLPDSVKRAARAAAKEALAEEGQVDDVAKYLVSLFAPSYVPFMKYSQRRDLRERLYRLYNSRNTSGEFDNSAIVKEIANSRLELARLMGKRNFAEYKLQGTMAAIPDNVLNLLHQLKEKYELPMRKEIFEIEDYARGIECPDFKLMPWDYSYFSEKMKDERYSFNDEALKPYFELQHTIEGVFGLATRLYGYTFKENKELDVYHPDVKVFEVYDDKGMILGLLYADFFYRAGKSPGAWMTEFRAETKDDSGTRELPLISIVCNFSKPVENEQVLLTPGEVETFLHEFGHALHGLSSQATYASLSGTNVYHDFVELFSQFNENYLTEKEFLDGFAKHCSTGEAIPRELVKRFARSRKFGAAYACMRQLGFGYLDMAYHMIEKPLDDTFSVADFEREAISPVKIFDMVEGCMISTSFGHIFAGGYAAGYYGYKWAEVLDADAFSAFKENGIFDKPTANRFHKMLASGGTVDPMELYKEFRGKEPTVDALLRRDGLA